MIGYCRFRLTDRAAYFDPGADLSLHKLKRKVELLCPNLEPFSVKCSIDLLGFLSRMMEVLNFQRFSEGLASPAIGFYPTGSTQTAYMNIVHPGTHDPTRLPMT